MARGLGFEKIATLVGGGGGAWLCSGILSDPSGRIVFALVGALLGAALPFALRAPIRDAEWRLRRQLERRADAIDAETGAISAGVEQWFGSFELRYLGGHPGLRPAGRPVYGQLEITDRAISFKDRESRIKMSPARIQRIILESPRQVMARKLSGVVSPSILSHRQPLVAGIFAEIVRRQRLVLVDYLDDLGERNWVIFHDNWMRPDLAARIKGALDACVHAVPKEKRVQAASRGTGSLPQALTGEHVAAAERASRSLLDEGSHVDGGARKAHVGTTPQGSSPRKGFQHHVDRLPVVEVRYDVVLESMGAGAEPHDGVVTELSRLFGKAPERFQELAKRLPVVVRRNLTEADAGRMREVLVRAGAGVRLDPSGGTPS